MKKPHPVFPLDAVLCCACLSNICSLCICASHVAIWHLTLSCPCPSPLQVFPDQFLYKVWQGPLHHQHHFPAHCAYPKLPQFHGVRLFGINKYWRGFDLQHKRMCGHLLCVNKKGGNLELHWMLCCFAVKVAEQSAMVSRLLMFFV